MRRALVLITQEIGANNQVGWFKILVTALVSSFVTACLTTPATTWIQRRTRRRELRRALYWETASNFGALVGQVAYSERDASIRNDLNLRFKMEYKRLAYDTALKDSSLLYSLGHLELYWIETLYRDFGTVIDGPFTDCEHRLRCARSVNYQFISMLKNRNLSKRQMFSVSRNWVRRHLRQELSLANYTDIETPTFGERLLRKWDQLQYWMWDRWSAESEH